MARIVRVRALAGQVVEIAFHDGFTGVVEMAHLIRPNAVTAALSDPAVFAEVRVGDGGRSIEWPGGVDFCADALRRRARPA